MQNNFYVAINYKFRTRVKGMYGDFSSRKTYTHKYLSEENINEMISDIKKLIKEDDAEIELMIDNLDWYGEPLLLYRFLNNWGSLMVVTWDKAEEHNYNSVDKTEITSRDIKKIVYSFINRMNTYIKSKED